MPKSKARRREFLFLRLIAMAGALRGLNRRLMLLSGRGSDNNEYFAKLK